MLTYFFSERFLYCLASAILIIFFLSHQVMVNILSVSEEHVVCYT